MASSSNPTAVLLYERPFEIDANAVMKAPVGVYAATLTFMENEA